MSANFLEELKAERDRIQSVIDILSKPTKRGYRGGRRKLSAAAKRHISQKLKEAWARRKAAAKGKA